MTEKVIKNYFSFRRILGICGAFVSEASGVRVRGSFMIDTSVSGPEGGYEEALVAT